MEKLKAEFMDKWFRPLPYTEEGNRLREKRESDLNNLLEEVAKKQREDIIAHVTHEVGMPATILKSIYNTPLVTSNQ